MTTYRYIDVSNHQGVVNWDQVKAAGVSGAICKATEDVTYSDPTFHPNWAALLARGLSRGAYHFARPGDPHAQARYFVANLQHPILLTDVLVLDLEVRVGGEANWALGFLQDVQTQTGLTPWLYSYASFIHTYLTDSRLAAYPLWIAAYQTSPPPCPPPWHQYMLWQHTDRASVAGVAGPVDESLGTLPGPSLSGSTLAKVAPMINPPLICEPIVADLVCPSGGAWALAESGAIYSFGGAPFHGGANGQPYFVNRKAARLLASDSPEIPPNWNPGVRPSGGYVIEDVDAEFYGPYGP